MTMTYGLPYGSDNLKELHTWEEADRLVKKFKVLVLERGQDSMENIIESNPFLKKYENQFIKVKENVRSNLSSTFVRDKIKRGKSIRYLTPDEVYYYIKEKHLFEN
jgi:nicotinate-nucleotide adenylyltransferase